MATAKVVFVALVAVFAIQVSGREIQPVNGLFDKVIELAISVLHKVTEVITEAVEFSTDIINTIIKDLTLVHDNAAEYTKKLIDAELTALNKLIDDAKEKANVTAGKILQCVEDVENDLVDLETTALEASATCTNGSISAVLQDAEQIIVDFSKIDDQINAEADALKKCEKKLIPFDCIKKVVENLIDIVTKVPADLKDDVSKIEADWKSLEEIVKQCATAVLPELKQKAETLATDFIQCIG